MSSLTSKGGRADVCSTPESKEIDGDLKAIAVAVFDELKLRYSKLTFQKRFRSPLHRAGCQPDGGLFFYDGRLIVAGEAKHQSDAGNAIERWYKNLFVLRQLEPNFTYLTYATGEGGYEYGTIGNTLSPAHLHGFNNYIRGENVCYLSVDGFMPKVMYEGLKGAIIDQIESTFYE